MVLVDAHCHLEKKTFADPAEVVARARAAGLVHAVVVGQWHGPRDFGAALEVAAAHPGFLTPTMGVHPHEAKGPDEADWATLEQLCARPDVCAVGEAGLDYYYDHSPRDVQRQVFARQCALASRLRKPLVVHVRDAHAECRELLAGEQVQRAMIHCFTGNRDDARAYLDLGFHLSISGIVTYKNAQPIQEAVAFAPLDRLLLETDTPYLAPVPHRGKKNEPMHVAETARKVAELKGLPADEVALACARNTRELLSLGFELP